MTYGELDRLSRAFASYLQNVARLPRGARVALMMPNLLQYPVALFGVAARRLRRRQLQSALFAARAASSAHRLRRRSDRRAGKFRADAGRTVDRGHGDQHGDRSPASAICSGAARTASSISSCGASSARCRTWRLPDAVRFPRALALGRGRKTRTAEDRAGRSRLPAIYRRHDRRAEGRDADASQHDRQSACRSTPGSTPAVATASETFVTALPLYHVFALTANSFIPMMIGANNLLIRRPARLPRVRQGAGGDAVHGHHRRQHAFQCAAQRPRFLRLDFSASAGCGRRRHGGAAGGRRALEARDRQAADRRLRPHRDLAAATINPLDLDEYTGSIGLPLPSTDIAIRDIDGAICRSATAGRTLHPRAAGDGRLLE